MDDVFQVLRDDHERVKQLLEGLERSGGDVADLADELVLVESKHEAAEEMCFWPAVRGELEDGPDLAREGIDQEEGAKELLEKLRTATGDSAGVAALIERLAASGRAHIEYEETQVWPKLAAALSPRQLEELGDAVDKARREGPMKPHPHAADET